MIDIKARLFEMQDLQYKDFQARLIPNISPQAIIGVRTPALRAFSHEVYADADCRAFLQELPHEYYDENNLHAFVIEKIKDYDECVAALNVFLPYVDNWATCDCMSPNVLAKNTDKLYGQIEKWIASEHTYTVRYGVKTLMSLYSKDKFTPEHFDLISSIKSDEHYVKMAVAWYLATVLAFHYEETVDFLKKGTVDIWTHNKAIQKATESYRIPAERKILLKNMRF